jgi:hypothetical protein
MTRPTVPALAITVAAIAALVAGCVTLSMALENSASIVNDPVIVTLVVNGLAVALLVGASYLLFQKRGLAGGLVAALAYVGVTSVVLDRGLDANAAKHNSQWDEERAVQELSRICDGSLAKDDRARPFDPSARQHELVLVEKSPHGTHVFAKEKLTIAQADLVACEERVEKTLETCTYRDDVHPQVPVSVPRIQVSSHVRFVAIKTGETVWETTAEGAPPRACGQFEGDRAIVGDPPNVRGIYAEHFAR